LGAYEDPDEREERIRWAGPVLGEGRILAASSDGRLASVNPANGEINEMIELDEAVSVAPVIANGTLYILTDEGSLIALR
jgi:outer membrane protein assembly factor BamB